MSEKIFVKWKMSGGGKCDLEQRGRYMRAQEDAGLEVVRDTPEGE